jgi:hypothetical protein
MSSTTLRPPVLVGSQRPRLESLPPRVSSAGREAVELAAAAGLYLDDWQQYVLEGMLGEDADRKWSAFEACLIVPRQNGKGSILEQGARQSAAVQQRLILWSAHEFRGRRRVPPDAGAGRAERVSVSPVALHPHGRRHRGDRFPQDSGSGFMSRSERFGSWVHW